LASLVYEALLLAALLLVAGFVLLPLGGTAPAESGALPVAGPLQRTLSFGWYVTVCALYFGWLWSGGRRTLPMTAWRLRLVTDCGEPLSRRRALGRFAAACIGPGIAIGAYAALAPLGHGRWAWLALVLNFAWALVDPERAFLHDRLAATRIVRAERGSAALGGRAQQAWRPERPERPD
jgi:uncharacterized RDD family membrane protein YckC